MPWELPQFLETDLVRAGWRALQTRCRLAATVEGLHTPRNKVAALEMSWYMRHQLLRDADWAGMAHGLEIRVPLVDAHLLRRLAPLLAAPSPASKREMALSAPIAPPPAVLDRPKTGFVVPVRDWLASDGGANEERGLRGWARRVYAEHVAHKAPGVLDPDVLAQGNAGQDNR